MTYDWQCSSNAHRETKPSSTHKKKARNKITEGNGEREIL